MIVYDLHCDAGHRFEGWFGSSRDFDEQQSRSLISCPECGSDAIAKAPMAPALTAKDKALSERSSPDPAQVTNTPIPPEMERAFKALAKAQAKALKSSTWVGDRFAEEARSQHYGEKDEAPIHGKASRKQAEELSAEGISIAPILFPVAEPDDLN